MGEGVTLLNRSACSRIGCPEGKSKHQSDQRSDGGFFLISSIHPGANPRSAFVAVVEPLEVGEILRRLCLLAAHAPLELGWLSSVSDAKPLSASSSLRIRELLLSQRNTEAFFQANRASLDRSCRTLNRTEIEAKDVDEKQDHNVKT